jgi:hypothetical protein
VEGEPVDCRARCEAAFAGEEEVVQVPRH